MSFLYSSTFTHLGGKLSYLESLFLGLLQGFTEFLPISSSGHIVLFQYLLGLKDQSLIISVAVHLGTLLSVLTVYHKPIFSLLHHLLVFPLKRKITPELKIIFHIGLATLVTGSMALLLRDEFKALFKNLPAVGFCFFLTGLFLFFIRKKGTHTSSSFLLFQDKQILTSLEHITLKQSLLIGLFQGFAVAPGLSRSGFTIGAGLISGLARRGAAFFSFLLSAPIILGASLFELKDIQLQDPQVLFPLFLAGLSAYVFGLLALILILRVVENGRLELFSFYLWFLSLAILSYYLI